MKAVSAPSHVHVLSFLTLSMFTVLFGFLAFIQHPTWMDPLVGLLLFIGMFRPREYVWALIRAFCSARSEEYPRKGFTHEGLNWEPPQVVPENDPRKPRVTEDILFPDFEYVVYGHSDVVWCLDEQPRIDFRWYIILAFRLCCH